MEKQTTAKEVQEYLNYLADLKKRTEWPLSLEIEDGVLYHVNDGMGNRVATFSKKIYDVFQEL
jgi:hypothetical protein